MKNVTINDYIKLHVDVLEKFNVVPVDVYIHLTRANKFIKVIHREEPFSKAILDHYKNKGVTHFLVLKNEYGPFAVKAASEISKEIEVSKNGSFCQSADIQQTAVQLILGEMMSVESIHEDTAALIYTTLKSVIDEVKKKPELGQILKCFMRRNDFLSGHSLQMAYIGALTLINMKMDSNDLLYKIIFGSIVHDISLVDTEFSKVLVKDELSYFSSKDQITIINHPIRTLEILNKMDESFHGVDSAIKTHHEVPSTGYPGKVGVKNITMLGAILCISEEFCTRMHGKEKDRNYLINLRAEFADKYKVGKFENPLVAFLKLCENLYVFSEINCSNYPNSK